MYSYYSAGPVQNYVSRAVNIQHGIPPAKPGLKTVRSRGQDCLTMKTYETIPETSTLFPSCFLPWKIASTTLHSGGATYSAVPGVEFQVHSWGILTSRSGRDLVQDKNLRTKHKYSNTHTITQPTSPT